MLGAEVAEAICKCAVARLHLAHNNNVVIEYAKVHIAIR